MTGARRAWRRTGDVACGLARRGRPGGRLLRAWWWLIDRAVFEWWWWTEAACPDRWPGYARLDAAIARAYWRWYNATSSWLLRNVGE